MQVSRRQLIALAAVAPASVFSNATPTSEVLPNKSVQVGDIDIGYRVTGSGEPLLLIMGFRGTMETWDPTFVPALAEHYQVITFDNRGIGSSGSSGMYSFSQLADDTAALIHALGFDRINVFGWSLGAMIALDLAIRHAGVINKLILHAGDVGGSESIKSSGDAIQDLFDASKSGEDRTEIDIDLLLPPEWVEAHREYVDQVFARPPGPTNPQGIVLQASTLIDWYRDHHDASTIEIPTLIVHGTDDIVIPVANAQLLADAIAGSWLVRMPGGHGLQYQVPLELAAITNVFLQTEA